MASAPITNTADSSAMTAQTAASAAPTTALGDATTFLRLLVAQLENQDPQNPADGTQFVTQLAQFSSLEQQLQIRADLDSMLGLMKKAAPAGAGS